MGNNGLTDAHGEPSCVQFVHIVRHHLPSLRFVYRASGLHEIMQIRFPRTKTGGHYGLVSEGNEPTL
jgi:hypothetical protein